MTAKRQVSSLIVLAGLIGAVIVAVLFAPGEETGGDFSSYSAGPTGTRLAYDLLARLGWVVRRREITFHDSAAVAPIQVVLRADVGAQEAHALLEHVRGGGSLLLGGLYGAMADSLPLVDGPAGHPSSGSAPTRCADTDPFEDQLRTITEVSSIGWRRPPPTDTVGFGKVSANDRSRQAAVGFPLGSGRIVVMSSELLVVNELMRRCAIGTDVVLVRMMEYLSHGTVGDTIAFDEFHHGYGVHGGSFTAIRMYLGGTGSGRMLAQLILAGLLLLAAAAPRPLAPRDPIRIARRSPLEHADALARAYDGVHATRTATTRLLAGVRRRARRDRLRSRESDEQLLATASAISPAAAAAARVVARGLDVSVPPRELPAIATAVATLESELTARPTKPTR